MKSILSRFVRKKSSETEMAVKYRHHARVFVSRNYETAIIVALHYNGPKGLLSEDEHPVVFRGPLEATTIGHETKVALDKTQIRAPVSFAKRKLKDWPAFKASKMNTVRQFEQDFIAIELSGANETNLVYAIEGYPEKDAELRVLASISSGAAPDILGEQIILVYRACRDRRI
jgi:hypothetical protein